MLCRHTLRARFLSCKLFPPVVYWWGLILKVYEVILGLFIWLSRILNKWYSLVGFAFHARGASFFLQTVDASFWNDIHAVLNVYACGMFHFIKCQSAFISVWDFLRGIELCFKGNMALMNIPFPHEITSCNNTAPLPKDILLQTLHALLQAHTLVHTSSLTNACMWVYTHSQIHTQIQVDYLYISIRMFTFNLPFSAQVLSDIILPAWLNKRISF